MLLYARAGAVTGRALGELLGLYARSTPRYPVLIRWGSAIRCIEATNCLNKREGVLNCCISTRMLRILKEAEIPCPEIVHGDVDFKVMLRKKHHYQGRDIIIADGGNVEELLSIHDREYATRFIPSIAEYRFHVFQDKVIKKFKKVGGEGVIRSSRFSWHYSIIKNTPMTAASELAINAVRVLGLDFGGVDILKSDSGNLYVLEVNSAPGLNSATLPEFARRVAECL